MAARTRFPRLSLPILCLALVCLSLPAWAGHWGVNYSVTPNGGGGFPIGPHFSGSYSQSLTVTATLTWSHDYPGEVPPTTVSYIESGSAGCGGQTTQTPTVNGLVNPKPVCDDGLCDPSVLANTNSTTQCYATSQGAHLVQKSYSSPLVLPARTLSINFTCDSAHSDSGSGSGGMGYSVAISTAGLGGHSTVDTSAVNNPWDPTHPRFFSGTNCSAVASVPAISGHVNHAQLLIGGTAINAGWTPVKDYYDTAFPGHPAAGPNVALGTNQSSASLSVIFDSTHFVDSAPVVVKVVVNDSGGNNCDGSISANTYNKATIYGRNQWESGSGASSAGTFAADSYLMGMNHTDTVNRNLGWSATNILGDIKTCTVFYVNTHGNSWPSFLSDVDVDCTPEVRQKVKVVYSERETAYYEPQTPHLHQRVQAASAA